MDKTELDGFLRQLSFFENLCKADSDINTILSCEPKSASERYTWRYMPYSDISISELKEMLTRYSSTPVFDEEAIPRGEKIAFMLSPRFLRIMEHTHSYIEMIYVYSGQCRQIINKEPVDMQEGDICILDTNVVHAIERASENDIIVNCLMKKSYFDYTMLSRLSGNDILSSFFIRAIYQSKDYNSYMLFRPGNNAIIRDAMMHMLCEYIDRKTCSGMVIDSYMIILFSELLRTHTTALNEKNHQALNQINISDIILYLQENYRDVTLKSTAEHFHFNMSYLSMNIKKITGKRFINLLHEIKLKKACDLLENSDMPIREIVNEAGYCNINFFYQLFEKYYGLTPLEYRKRIPRF